MKREFSLKQIMQMILVCLLLVAVVYGNPAQRKNNQKDEKGV